MESKEHLEDDITHKVARVLERFLSARIEHGELPFISYNNGYTYCSKYLNITKIEYEWAVKSLFYLNYVGYSFDDRGRCFLTVVNNETLQ